VPRIDFMTLLRAEVLRPDYFATPARIQEFTQVFSPSLGEVERKVLLLLHRLRKPQQLPPAAPLPEGATPDDDWQEGLRQQAEDEDPHFKLPLAREPVAEGQEREAAREELRQLVDLETAAIDAAWESLSAEDGAPLTPLERDVLAAAVSPQAEALRRQEDSCFRQFWRTATLLAKLQQEKPQGRDSACEEIKAQSGVRSPGSEHSNAQPEVQGPEAGDLQAASEVPSPGSRDSKIAGASGDVQESKGPVLRLGARHGVPLQCAAPTRNGHQAGGARVNRAESGEEENRQHFPPNIL